MKDDPHIIIIGAGLIGLSCADSLTARGARVTVIERATAPMRGTSFANSGMIHPSQAWPWTDVKAPRQAARAVLELAKRSAPLIAATAQRLGLPMQNRAPGCLQMFRNTRSWEAAQSRYDSLGIAYRRQPIGGVLGDYPALFFPTDFSGNAYDYGAALADDLCARGVEIIFDTACRPLLRDGRVIGVTGSKGEIMTDHVILAAGPASDALARSVGLSLPLSPLKGYAVSYTMPAKLDIPKVPVMDAHSRSAVSVFGDVLRLSGTAGAPNAQTLLDIWAALIPGLADNLGAPITPIWQADRPMSDTGTPLIGRSSVPGLWVNTGHGPMGWTLCAGSGAVMADMIIDGQTAPEFSPQMVGMKKVSVSL